MDDGFPAQNGCGERGGNLAGLIEGGNSRCAGFQERVQPVPII